MPSASVSRILLDTVVKLKVDTHENEEEATGVPVICNDIGDTGNIINETATGLVVNKFDKPSLQEAVNKIGALNQISKEHIRSCAENYFDLKTGVQKYLGLYHSLMA